MKKWIFLEHINKVYFFNLPYILFVKKTEFREIRLNYREIRESIAKPRFWNFLLYNKCQNITKGTQTQENSLLLGDFPEFLGETKNENRFLCYFFFN